MPAPYLLASPVRPPSSGVPSTLLPSSREVLPLLRRRRLNLNSREVKRGPPPWAPSCVDEALCQSQVTRGPPPWASSSSSSYLSRAPPPRRPPQASEQAWAREASCLQEEPSLSQTRAWAPRRAPPPPPPC